jgi:hypothetical protein
MMLATPHHAACCSARRGGTADPAVLNAPTTTTARGGGSGDCVGGGGVGSASVKFKRPPGRAPSGKVWDIATGEWVMAVAAPRFPSIARAAASASAPPPSCALVARLNDVAMRNALVAVGRVTLPVEHVRRAVARAAACRGGVAPKGGLWLPLELELVGGARRGAAREGALVGALCARGLVLHVVPATAAKLEKLRAGAARAGGALEIAPNLAVGHAMKTKKEECGAHGHAGCWVKPTPSAYIRGLARWCG